MNVKLNSVTMRVVSLVNLVGGLFVRFDYTIICEPL